MNEDFTYVDKEIQLEEHHCQNRGQNEMSQQCFIMVTLYPWGNKVTRIQNKYCSTLLLNVNSTYTLRFLKSIEGLGSVAQKQKQKWYREHQHGPCIRMTHKKKKQIEPSIFNKTKTKRKHKELIYIWIISYHLKYWKLKLRF